MAKVLVTGGAGFIGSHVVDALLNLGFQVVIVDDLSTGFRENLNPNAQFYKLDIRALTHKFFAKEQPDYIIHHAAQMNVRRSVIDPLFDADVNILGTLKLLQLSRQFHIKRFVHISSSAVYGEPRYLPVDEDHPIDPVCEYGVSKHTLEHYLYLYEKNYGMPYTVFRYPNVYGPRQDPQGEAGVVAQLTHKILCGLPVTIYGDGQQTRDFVHVSEIARANVMAVTQEHPSGIYNLGSGVPTSVSWIFDKLRDLSGYQFAPLYADPILGETRHIHLNAAKVRIALGWRASIDMEVGLWSTLKYYRSKQVKI